ncbi:MAG TPA: hypothetical protein EYN66_23940 [Myxococcales bacterium]|nr:hypothetical protein [Myxococcales bacterium]
MKQFLKALIILAVLASASTASAQLNEHYDPPFSAEAFMGMVFQLTSFEQEDPTGLQNDPISWAPRIQMGGAAAVRIWNPLHMDLGLRLGLSFQNSQVIGEITKSYDKPITMFEITPYVKAVIYPFVDDRWGISVETGVGMLIGSGGKQGATLIPKKTQTALRIRFAVGALWRYEKSVAITFDVASLVTDISLTTEWQGEVGTILNLEPRIGWQYRF